RCCTLRDRQFRDPALRHIPAPLPSKETQRGRKQSQSSLGPQRWMFWSRDRAQMSDANIHCPKCKWAGQLAPPIDLLLYQLLGVCHDVRNIEAQLVQSDRPWGRSAEAIQANHTAVMA